MTEEIIERAVVYAYYDDIVTQQELVEIMGEEAKGARYLKQTIESDVRARGFEDGIESGEVYWEIVNSAPVPGDGYA